MLDEATLTSVLTQHFRSASKEEIHEAAYDVLLLELFEADDAGVAWEDAMREPDRRCVTVFVGDRRE